MHRTYKGIGKNIRKKEKECDKAVRARQLFKDGYNCCQSVFCAFTEHTGMDFESALKISSSFGGGMGRLREVCGAVTAMFMVAGLKYGYVNKDDLEKKAEHYALIQSLANEFKQKHNSIICRELLELDEDISVPIPDKRDDKYYEQRPCDDLVASAADIINNLIMEDKE
ncbi:MAG: C-GCAxxG-C-C family protein [Bacillota bacterium]